MLARVHSCSVIGVEGALVEVEVAISGEAAPFTVVGLPDRVIQAIEARIEAAIKQSTDLFPPQGITIHCQPAEICKEGQGYDLPIAIGIVLASGQVKPETEITECLFLGELASDGRVLHTKGILPMVVLAREKQCHTVFVPAEDAGEAALVGGITIYPVETLGQLVAHLGGGRQIEPYTPDPHILAPREEVSYAHDMATVCGQEHVKRALEVAVSGGHHSILSGPPGAQKRVLAQATPSLFPAMTVEEALVVTKIASVNGLISSVFPLLMQRPFRAPPLTSSQEDFLGSRHPSRLGEMSLAHEGVLFLEELPAYEPQMQETVCRALERKKVPISHADTRFTSPARFLLLASMRPCPCGYFTDPVKACACSPAEIAGYQRHVSRHLLDFIDISIEVPRLDEGKLAQKRQAEHSHIIRVRVQEARERQRRRFAGTPLISNAEMGPSELRTFCRLEPAAEKMVQAAIQQLHLSTHAFHRALKVARTIADLARSERIAAHHIAEAIQYRPRIGIERAAQPRCG